jgi:hypothetical protein
MTTAICFKDVYDLDWDEELHPEVAALRPSFSTSRMHWEMGHSQCNAAAVIVAVEQLVRVYCCC